MRRSRVHFALAILVAAAATACGDPGSGAVVTDFGACDDRADFLDSGFALLADVDRVVEMSSEDILTALEMAEPWGDDRNVLDISAVLPASKDLGGHSQEPIRTLVGGVADLENAMRVPYTSQLILGASHLDGQTSIVKVIAVVDNGEVVGFAGLCANGLFDPPFDAFVEGGSRSSDQLVDMLTTDEGIRHLTAESSFEAPAWADLDPAARFLDPEGTPAEVLARMTPIALQVSVPGEWLEIDAVLATRVSEGWNEGAWLPGGWSAGGDGRVVLYGWANASEPIEIWVFDSDMMLAEPLAKLGSVPGPDPVEGEHIIGVRISGPTEAKDIASIVDAAIRGDITLQEADAIQEDEWRTVSSSEPYDPSNP